MIEQATHCVTMQDVLRVTRIVAVDGDTATGQNGVAYDFPGQGPVVNDYVVVATDASMLNETPVKHLLRRADYNSKCRSYAT